LDGERHLSYDVSLLEPIERALLGQVLDRREIAHEMYDGVLVVALRDEADVDEIISGVENYAGELRAEGERDEKIRAGDRSLQRCEFCGASPAAPLRLRRQVGMVIVSSTHTFDALLCNTCASTATRSFQKQTAIKGWTGIRSALMNPVVLTSNAKNRRRHRKQIDGGK
jgi:hypothetical protein